MQVANEIKKYLNEPLYFEHYWQYLLIIIASEFVVALVACIALKGG
jgi:hypothetical protein